MLVVIACDQLLIAEYWYRDHVRLARRVQFVTYASWLTYTCTYVDQRVYFARYLARSFIALSPIAHLLQPILFLNNGKIQRGTSAAAEKNV